MTLCLKQLFHLGIEAPNPWQRLTKPSCHLGAVYRLWLAFDRHPVQFSAKKGVSTSSLTCVDIRCASHGLAGRQRQEVLSKGVLCQSGSKDFDRGQEGTFCDIMRDVVRKDARHVGRRWRQLPVSNRQGLTTAHMMGRTGLNATCFVKSPCHSTRLLQCVHRDGRSW